MNKNIKGSVQLTKISPLLSGNIKIVTDGYKGLWVDEIEENKSNPIRLDFNSSFGNAIKKMSTKYGGDNDSFYRSSFFYSLDSNFQDQYQNTFEMGVTLNNNPIYNKRFRIFAPIYLNLEKIPTHFVVFKRLVNLNSTVESANLYKGASAVQVFDLNNGYFGAWFQNHVNFLNENRLNLDLFLNFEQRSSIGGYDVKTGILTQKYEKIDFNIERTIYDFDRYLTNIYYRNSIIHPRFLNLEFAFDDNSQLYDHYYYFGAYLYADETIPLNYDYNLDLTLSTELQNEIVNGRIILFSDSTNNSFKIDSSIGNLLQLSPDASNVDLSGKNIINTFNIAQVSSGVSSQVMYKMDRLPFKGERITIHIKNYTLSLIATKNENITLNQFKIGSNLDETRLNFIESLDKLLDNDVNTDFSVCDYNGNILIYSNSYSQYWDNYIFTYNSFISQVEPFFVKDDVYEKDKTYGYSPETKTIRITNSIVNILGILSNQNHYLGIGGIFHRIRAILPYVVNGVVEKDTSVIILDNAYSKNDFKSIANLAIDAVDNIYKMSFATLGDLSTSTNDTTYGKSLYEFDSIAYKKYLIDRLNIERQTATSERIVGINREIEIINNTFNNLNETRPLQYLDRVLNTEYDYFYENEEINTVIERVNPKTIRWSYSFLNDVRNNEMRANVSKIFRRNFTPIQKKDSRDLKFYAFDWFLLGNGLPPYNGLFDKRGYIDVVEEDFKSVEEDIYLKMESANDSNFGIIRRVGNGVFAFFRGQIIEVPPNYENWKFSVVFRNQPTIGSTDVKVIENNKFNTLTIFITKDLDDSIFLRHGLETDSKRFIDRSYFYMSDRIYEKGGNILKIPITTNVKLFYDEIIPNSFERNDNWIREDNLGEIFTVSTPNSDNDLRNFFTVSTEQTTQILIGESDMIYCKNFVSVGFNGFECREIYYVQNYLNTPIDQWDDETNVNVEKFKSSWLKEEYIDEGNFFKINQRLASARLYISFLDQTFAENFINEISLTGLKARIEKELQIEKIDIFGSVTYDTIDSFRFIQLINFNVGQNITINEVIDSDVTLYSSSLIGYNYSTNNNSYEIQRYSGRVEPIIHRLNKSTDLDNTYHLGYENIKHYYILKKGGANIIQDNNREIGLIGNTKFFRKDLSLVENVFSNGRYKAFSLGGDVINLDRFSFPNYQKSMMANVYPLTPKEITVDYDLSDFIDSENIDLLPKFALSLYSIIGDNIGIEWYRYIAEKYYKVKVIDLKDSTNRLDRFFLNTTNISSFKVIFALNYSI